MTVRADLFCFSTLSTCPDVSGDKKESCLHSFGEGGKGEEMQLNHIFDESLRDRDEEQRNWLECRGEAHLPCLAPDFVGK